LLYDTLNYLKKMSLDFYLEMDLDTGASELYNVELYSANITHNLNKMAMEAGIYKCLWRPNELWENPTADKLIPILEEGLENLKSNPKHFKKFDASNGWGTYKDFVPFVEEVLNACKEHPKSKVRTWI
jgi:hypothetical protein